MWLDPTTAILGALGLAWVVVIVFDLDRHRGCKRACKGSLAGDELPASENTTRTRVQ